jgi:adenylate cyclase
VGRAAWRKRKALLLVAAAILAAGIGVLAYATHLLRRTELQTIDARFSVRGRQAAPPDVVLVGIDNATIDEMREHEIKTELPLPRRYDAKVIEHLLHAGAKVIAMDMEFASETDAPDDNALIEAIEGAHGKTVLAAANIGKGGAVPVLGGDERLREFGARAGAVILSEDSDGVIRRFAYSTDGLRSFPVVAVEVATGHPVSDALFGGGTLPIDFAGPPGTVKEIPYWDVWHNTFPAGAVAGKVVIIGAIAPIFQDLHLAATSGKHVMPGPEIWANATATLLKGIPLRDVGGGLNLLLIVLMGALTPLSSLRVRPWRALADALAAAIVFTVVTQVMFNSGWIVSFVYPLLALALGTLGTLAILYLSEAIERQRTHDVFSRFVPADVVDQVMARTDENLRLGAVERDCTVLFSDLRGFTSFSENQPAPRVIEVVNCYLNEMTEAIMAAGGTLIAYMGDGIMAVFGAPLEQPDHADRALKAAVEMIGPRLEKFNSWLKEQGHEHEFAMGVGINSGSVMAGNIGSEQRVEYTALGDTTNTASRLEGMTKGSGHMLFIAETTRERMHDPPASLTLVGEFEVRGRVAKVPVWTVAAAGKLPRDPEGGSGADLRSTSTSP